jgi:Leucine-rich repeat (LRR) protein
MKIVPAPEELTKKKGKSGKVIIKQYDDDGNLIREKKVKIDELGNPIKKEKKKLKRGKSTSTDIVDHILDFPVNQKPAHTTRSDFDKKLQGPTFETRRTRDSFYKPYLNNTNENSPSNKHDASLEGKQIQPVSGEESVSTLGNKSAAEAVRPTYFSKFAYAQPQQSYKQYSGPTLHHNGNQQLQNGGGQQPMPNDGHSLGKDEFRDPDYDSKPPSCKTNDEVDKFRIFALDFEGYRPREGQGANVDKMRMFVDSFEVTPEQFLHPVGMPKPPAYTTGNYGVQQGYEHRLQPPINSPPPVAYSTVFNEAAVTDSEIQARAETHALVVQYMILSGVDPVIAEQMACEFEEAQMQGMCNYASGVPTNSAAEVDKFDMFSEGDEASVPSAIVRALVQGSAMANNEQNEQVEMLRAASSIHSSAVRTAQPYSAAHMTVAPLTPDHSDENATTTRALLIQYLISIGTDPVAAEQMADEFSDQQAAATAMPRQNQSVVASAYMTAGMGQEQLVQSFHRKHLEAMNGGYNSRKSDPGFGASTTVAGRGPMSQSMPPSRRPPRAERPGAVEMQGRAFGAPRREQNDALRNGQNDEEVEPPDLEADLAHGNYIQAVPVTEKEPASSNGPAIVYAESTTFGIKQLLSEGPVRRLLFLLCVIIVGVTIGVTVVVLQSSNKGTPAVIAVTSSPSVTPTSSPSFIGVDIERAASAISGVGSVLTIGSPQRRAVGWMSSKDKFDTQGIAVVFLQRYILTVFHYATNGEQWLEQDRWLSPTLHVCDWSSAIICGTDLPRRQVVTGIDLTRNGLSGHIPNELGLLEGLTLLRLARNAINGTIPEALSTSLTSIAQLDLSANNLSGTVPTGIGNLKNLNSLELFDNALTGTIPPSTYDLERLENFDLSKNKLTGLLLQDVEKLRSLVTLNLRNNQLSGQLPAMKGMSNLDYILLDNNQFSGSLPSFSRDFFGRWEFSISHNRISGGIPGLEDVNVTEIGANEFIIQRIDVSHNQLTGTINEWIAFVPSFGSVDFSGNAFTGPIPAIASGAGWRGLQYFGAAGNKLNGAFPLGFSSSLTSLDISDNRLTGGFPLDLYSAFPNLKSLVASDNPLGGRLSGLLGKLVDLRDLRINNCSLTGVLPINVRGLQSLEYFSAQDNGITGFIPSDFGSLVGLRELELQNNKLTATLPSEIGSLELLNALNVANNNLTGSLPSSLTLLTELKELDISGNSFVGEFPQGLCDSLKVTRSMVGCDLDCGCCSPENGTDICGGIFKRGGTLSGFWLV